MPLDQEEWYKDTSMVTPHFCQNREYLCASNTYRVLPFSGCEDSFRITWNLIFGVLNSAGFQQLQMELHILSVSENEDMLAFLPCLHTVV